MAPRGSDPGGAPQIGESDARLDRNLQAEQHPFDRFDRMGAAFFVVKRAEWRGKKKIEIGREGAMKLKTVKSDKAKYGFSAIETKKSGNAHFYAIKT